MCPKHMRVFRANWIAYVYFIYDFMISWYHSQFLKDMWLVWQIKNWLNYPNTAVETTWTWNLGFIQETADQGVPLHCACLQLQMHHLRGCQGQRLKLGTHAVKQFSSTYIRTRLFFSQHLHNDPDSPSRGFHIAKASWRLWKHMTVWSIGPTNDFTNVHRKESWTPAYIQPPCQSFRLIELKNGPMDYSWN